MAKIQYRYVFPKVSRASRIISTFTFLVGASVAFYLFWVLFFTTILK